MKILVVGNGGREHALLWKLHHDAPEAELFITRGNGGTADLATALPHGPADIRALLSWAEEEQPDLTVVGPEIPLAAGIVDHFAQKGLPIFGPTRKAARIESSKLFAKELMARHGIPTAAFATFDEFAAAEAYVQAADRPLVVKASGLAGGKGAVVCPHADDALKAIRDMLMLGTYGAAGAQVVVEDFMEGEELSVFALCDGEHALPMLPAQDYKRIGEGDTGPNTGGMGAYAPVSRATDALMERVRREILQPTLAAMAAEGKPFRGLLYAGLMLTAEGPKVVEFNCRFGDPETQAVLPLLQSSLLQPMLAVARGESLAGMKLQWRNAAAVTTVLASEGYPNSYTAGRTIRIPPQIEQNPDVLVFHAGTTRRDDQLLSSGGRVLAVTALAPTVKSAAAASIRAAGQIDFEGRYFRRDIAWREMAHSGAPHAGTAGS